MAEWSARRTRNPAVSGSSPEFKSSTIHVLVRSQRLCLRPVEILAMLCSI